MYAHTQDLVSAVDFMKFNAWMKKNQNGHFLIKKFYRYYNSNAGLSTYSKKDTILRYFLKNEVGEEIIREFNTVWLFYTEGIQEVMIQYQVKKTES